MAFDVHLSWSPLLFTSVALVEAVIACTLIYLYKQHLRKILLTYFVVFVLILLSAIDVGTRQSELDRSQFNSDVVVMPLEKVESTRTTADIAEQSFNAQLNK